jgi:hypothetical protein
MREGQPLRVDSLKTEEKTKFDDLKLQGGRILYPQLHLE